MGYEFYKRKLLKDADNTSFRKKDAKAKDSLPNSMVMRIMQESEAEKEADRLSQGITSQTPDEVMREMGNRLNADFSDVRFHTDPGSADKSEKMNARAWTQGRDVYFGKGGFEPATAAHELVHTVQQGAISGNVSQSMPMGSIQLKPNELGAEDGEILEDMKITRDSDFQAILTQIFSTQNGRKIYDRLENDLFKLIKKGAGPQFRRCTKEQGINFLVSAAEKDYTGKSVLSNIMRQSTETDHFARRRLYDYQEFIQFLSNRLKDSDIEEAAMDSNLLTAPPQYEHNQRHEKKRAYELDVPGKDSNKIDFNPTNDPELEQVQDAIDHAANAREAYSIFGRFSGNSSAKYVNKVKQETNIDELKTKLKNMARVVRDYPELQGQIGNMIVDSPTAEKQRYMGAVGNYGGLQKAELHYNAYWDTAEGSEKRDKEFASHKNRYLTGNKDFAGTHELGHVLASTLIDQKDEVEANREQNAGLHESIILDKVLSNKEIMPEADYQNLTKYTKEDWEKSKSPKGTPGLVLGGINTRKSKLFQKGYTSYYGADNPTEFFAEAFHDVYANGNKAKPASIATVQEYEKRQKVLTAKKFFRPKRSLWRRFVNWLKW